MILGTFSFQSFSNFFLISISNPLLYLFSTVSFQKYMKEKFGIKKKKTCDRTSKKN